jgi:hypothetical protein
VEKIRNIEKLGSIKITFRIFLKSSRKSEAEIVANKK